MKLFDTSPRSKTLRPSSSASVSRASAGAREPDSHGSRFGPKAAWPTCGSAPSSSSGVRSVSPFGAVPLSVDPSDAAKMVVSRGFPYGRRLQLNIVAGEVEIDPLALDRATR
jgi:hypothetical protein